MLAMVRSEWSAAERASAHNLKLAQKQKQKQLRGQAAQHAAEMADAQARMAHAQALHDAQEEQASLTTVRVDILAAGEAENDEDG